MTEKPEYTQPDIADPRMPVYTENEIAHQEMMRNPAYAVATHEQQLNKFADILEELSARVIALEQVINEMNTPDLNDPIKDYPEVAAHQNK